MTTNEGPLRWKCLRSIRRKFKYWTLRGKQIYHIGEWTPLRLLIFFALFFPFITPLMDLDDRIQSKKFAKGYNLQRQGILNYNWNDL